VPNVALTNAERILDTYLPPLKTGENDVQVVDTHELGSYKRAKRLTRSIYDRSKERIWILVLYVINLFVDVLRIFTDLIGSLLQFVYDNAINFVRGPRVFISNLFGLGYLWIQFGIYLIFHPYRLIELFFAWLERLRSRRRTFAKFGRKQKEERLSSNRTAKKRKTRYEVKELLKREDLPEVVVGTENTD